jgi:hypothetical protein
MAKKLKECQVFGVSSYECLDYAIQNRNEWKERGQQLVDDLVQELTSPIPIVGGQLTALKEDEAPAIPSVIGVDNSRRTSALKILPSNIAPIDERLDDEDVSMKDIPLNDSDFQKLPIGEPLEITNNRSGVPMAA